MACARIIVRGRVQGVGFRYFALREARALGIDGWARNLPDGSVEIEASGEPHVLETFIESIRLGPPYSKVSSVEVSAAPETKRVPGFCIH